MRPRPKMTNRVRNASMRIYIAGPYTAMRPSDVDRNIITARDAQAELFRMGHTPLCPHSMTARFERDYPDISYEVYINTDLEWLKLCDAILMLPGWKGSKGSIKEHQFAIDNGIEVYYSLKEVPVGDRVVNDASNRSMIGK